MLESHEHIFISESVSEGHPDKLADQISDAVLDTCLMNDPESRVACETFISQDMILVGGEITTSAYIDMPDIIYNVVWDVGYTHAEYGLDIDEIGLLNVIHNQSKDIARGVTRNALYSGQQGAGDQGIIFGFACDETAEFMPATLMYAHKILQQAAKLRKEGTISWLRPDSKSQVAIVYEGYKPVRIDSIVLSHQHDPNVSTDEIRECLIAEVIRPVCEVDDMLTEDTTFYINPTGRFVIGGPNGDVGLTGRKIIADTYGGAARHGGGAFSGKDSSKVDRSAAYMARYIAKNLVAAGIAKRIEIQLAYAIGVPFPVGVAVESFGTAVIDDVKIAKLVQNMFDLEPSKIEETLDLRTPMYRKTTNYGHFGRNGLNWEKLDRIDAVQSALSGGQV